MMFGDIQEFERYEEWDRVAEQINISFSTGATPASGRFVRGGYQ